MAGRSTPTFFVCLLAGVTGGLAQDASCLKCHESVREVLQKKVKHAAVESGCDSCHIDHQKPRAANDPKPLAHYLTADVPALCLTCHDVKDQKVAAAHHGQPIEKADCVACHNPHASDSPKLVAAQPHTPFEAGMCDSCHAAPVNGKVKLTAASVSELCFTCHEDTKSLLATAPVKHSLLAADANVCTDCHDPHVTGNKAMLKQPGNSLCQTCHPDIAKKEFVHEAVKTGCTVCHNPHASAHKGHLRAEANALCLECHASETVARFGADQPVELFNKEVRLPAKPYAELKVLELHNGAGHPGGTHPTIRKAAGKTPAIGCLSCHNPHATGGGPRLLVTETASSSKLCVWCHK